MAVAISQQTVTICILLYIV